MAAQVEKIAGKNNAMEIFLSRAPESKGREAACPVSSQPPPKNRVLAVTEKNEPTFHPNA